MAGSSTTRYSAELRERAVRAVRAVAEVRADHGSEWAAMTRVAELSGVGTAETVRKWCRQAEVDAGDRSGSTSEESAEVKRLKRENAELKRANGMAGPCADRLNPPTADTTQEVTAQTTIPALSA